MELILEEIIEAHRLKNLATADGFVHTEINEAWHGSKQSGRIAHDDLVKRSRMTGHKNVPLVEGHFCHKTHNVNFCLVINDFLMRHDAEEDSEHLCATARENHKFEVDEAAHQFVGVNLRWDCEKRTARLSMDGCMEQALLEFQHAKPKVPCHAPSWCERPHCGQRVQHAQTDDTDTLGALQINHVQKIAGKLLCCVRAVDPTMLHAINAVGAHNAV